MFSTEILVEEFKPVASEKCEFENRDESGLLTLFLKNLDNQESDAKNKIGNFLFN